MTTWEPDEWEGLMLLVEEWWKDELPDRTRLAWKVALDGVEPTAAVATLKQLLRRGQTWRPSVAEFIAALEPAVPTWEEAWPGIHMAMSSYDPYDVEASSRRVLGLLRGWGGNHVAGWVASYGVRRLATEPVDDPDYGGAVVKRLGDNYAQAMSEPAGRDRLAAALNGLPRRGELRGVDPLAALAEGAS